MCRFRLQGLLLSYRLIPASVRANPHGTENMVRLTRTRAKQYVTFHIRLDAIDGRASGNATMYIRHCPSDTLAHPKVRKAPRKAEMALLI